MKIKKLKLFTDKLADCLEFYTQVLGFELIKHSNNSCSFKIGWTELEFEESNTEQNYHFCFLIPSNLLDVALTWMENRVPIIKIEKDRKTQSFETWNAASFYFYDPNGNLAEFIVHYDLESSETSFHPSKVLGICEMGMPTENIKLLDTQLHSALSSSFWKGDYKRFGTNGSIEGKFLLPNYKIKKTWFPTNLTITPFDFEAVIENDQKEYVVVFKDEKLSINTTTH